MHKIIQTLPENTRNNLRNQMHKVAACLTKQEGFSLARDEITIKEASFLLGQRFWKHYLEKRAMFDGITHVMRIGL